MEAGLNLDAASGGARKASSATGPRLGARVEEVFTGDLLARIKATPGD